MALTDEQVEQQIKELQQDEYVKLAHKHRDLKYKRRKYLYQLRFEQKQGKELAAAGITLENIEQVLFPED